MGRMLARSVFTISLDLPRERSRATDELLRMMRRASCPGTWCAEEPAGCATTLQVRDELPGHEVALMGDLSWVGQGRTHFARELVRRCREATSAGFSIDTLALRDVELTEHLDLLVKRKISVVRPHAVAEAGFRPQSSRYGIWQAPAGFHLPDHNRWPFGGTEWSLRRAMRRAVDVPAILHLSIDVKQLADLRPVERILVEVHRRRSEGVLRTVTLSDFARELKPQRATHAGKSALRVA